MQGSPPVPGGFQEQGSIDFENEGSTEGAGRLEAFQMAERVSLVDQIGRAPAPGVLRQRPGLEQLSREPRDGVAVPSEVSQEESDVVSLTPERACH